MAGQRAYRAFGNALAAAEKVRDQTRSDSLKQQAADVIEKAGEGLGFIMIWQIAGPYAEAGKDDETLFDITFAPKKDVAQADWRPMPVSDDASTFWLLDLDRAIGGRSRVAYARTVLVSPDEREAVFEIGSDDGIKVWVNGQLVHAHNKRRGNDPGQDTVVGVACRGRQ